MPLSEQQSIGKFILVDPPFNILSVDDLMVPLIFIVICIKSYDVCRMGDII